MFQLGRLPCTNNLNIPSLCPPSPTALLIASTQILPDSALIPNFELVKFAEFFFYYYYSFLGGRGLAYLWLVLLANEIYFQSLILYLLGWIGLSERILFRLRLFNFSVFPLHTWSSLCIANLQFILQAPTIISNCEMFGFFKQISLLITPFFLHILQGTQKLLRMRKFVLLKLLLQ